MSTKLKPTTITATTLQGDTVRIAQVDFSGSGPTANERRQLFARGLPHQIAIAKSYGRDVSMAVEHLPTIQKMVVDLEGMENELDQPEPNFITELRAKAARELHDKLHACFPTLRDAVQFTASLPFIDAKTKRAEWLENRTKLGRRYNEGQKAFWILADEIGRTLDIANRPDRGADVIVQLGAV